MASDLRKIPGVGEKIEKKLMNLGYNSISDLKNQSPEEIFQRYQERYGKACKCLLYVYRLAVYYANNETHEAEKLKWGYWRDGRA